MKCYVCSSENWHQVMVQVGDRKLPIHSEAKLQICKDCGSFCHEVEPSREASVLEYYRKSYRPAPNISNLITTGHKQNYIRLFLEGFLKERQGKRLKIADIGCATGYLLGFFKRMGHLVAGSEYTLPYRRMAEHYYGVPVTEEIESKHRYDLITIYHVLEHMVEPDKKLAHYASLLNEGGHIMVATPQWLGDLEENSGGKTESFEHLYHKDHINLFTRTSLQNLFRKVGLVIAKVEYEQYGQTYLLRKAKEGDIPKDSLNRENWVDIEREILRDHKSISLCAQGKFKEAIEVKPRFPEAWIGLIFLKATKDLSRQSELFVEAEALMPTNLRLKLSKAQWLYQQGRLEEAMVEFHKIVSVRPNEDVYMYMGYSCAQLGRVPEAIGYFEVAQEMDPRKWQECQNWVLKLVCSLPAWDERAMAQAKEFLMGQALAKGEVKIEFKSPMDEEMAKDEKAAAKTN